MRLSTGRYLAVGVFLVALGGTRGAGTARAQAPTVTVGGLAYAQYVYQAHRDSVTGAHLNGFDIALAALPPGPMAATSAV